MTATVLHVISGLGVRKFQADGFLLAQVYKDLHLKQTPRFFLLLLDWSIMGLIAEADRRLQSLMGLRGLAYFIDNAVAQNVLRAVLIVHVFYNYINLLASFAYSILIKMREKKKGKTNDCREHKAKWCAAE